MVMLSILQCSADVMASVFGGAGVMMSNGCSAVGTYLVVGAVSYERLFILVFTPIFGVILTILGWRAWKQINKSQR